MRKFKIWVISLISLSVLIILGVCCLSGYLVFQGSMQLVTNETTASTYDAYLKEAGIDVESFNKQYDLEKVSIKSSLDGHEIPADYLLANENQNNDTVILVHGLGGNRLSLYPIAQIYLENGYNVITYDQRSSGENTAKHTTGGYLESRDLLDYISYVDGIVEKDKNIGVFGTSFGGATVGIALGSQVANERLAFAVLDCPMSEMEYMIEEEIEQMDIGIPTSFFVTMGDLMTRVLLGFSYEDMNVMNYIEKTTVPVLIFNSEVDATTPYFMGEDLFQAIPHEQKQLLTVSDSEHAKIFFDYKELYVEELVKLLP